MVNRLLLITFGVLFFSIASAQQNSKTLFNGKTLDGWEITDIEGHGKVTVADSCIIIGVGEPITGINWLSDFPVTNFEVTLQARRIEGKDFFCAMTFPVKNSYCTLVLGGWGGSMIGLSSIDGYDAANNFTGDVRFFTQNQWYPIRLRVTDETIEAWINNDKIVDFIIGTYRISLRYEMEQSVPFGFATYETIGALRRIKVTTFTE